MSHSNFSGHQDSYTHRVPQLCHHQEPTHILSLICNVCVYSHQSDDTTFRITKFISPCFTVVVALVHQYFEQRLMKSNRQISSAKDGAGIHSILIEIAKQWSDCSFRRVFM